MRIDKVIADRGQFLTVDDEGLVTLVWETGLREMLQAGHEPIIVLNLLAVAARFKTLMPTEKLLTSAQVQQVSLTSYRQLGHWCELGILSPLVHEDGTMRLWDREAVFAVCLLSSLRRRGQSLPVLKQVAELLREAEPAATT